VNWARVHFFREQHRVPGSHLLSYLVWFIDDLFSNALFLEWNDRPMRQQKSNQGRSAVPMPAACAMVRIGADFRRADKHLRGLRLRLWFLQRSA